MSHKLITILSEYWKRLLPEWRFAISSFLVTRLALTLWSLLVSIIIPVALQNLVLLNQPILTVFNLQTSTAHIYSRFLDERVLTFRVMDSVHFVDNQTGSIWFVGDGMAVDGLLRGQSLPPSSFSAEAIFPYLGVPVAKNPALALWQRFDANWYLKIALRGYESADGSTVYFPMYPAFIKILAYFMQPVLSAMVISNLALVGCLVLFFRWAMLLFGATVARRSSIYFLLFPTAFFLTAPYTESLFLFFALASLFAASQARWGAAGLCGALSALTRLQGVLLIVPLLYMAWQGTRQLPLRTFIRHSLTLSVIPLATLVFLIFTNLSLVNTYEGRLNARFVFPWENLYASLSLLIGGNGSIIDALNLIMTVGLIGMMYFVWKTLPLEYTLYSVLMLVAPMLRMTTTQPLVSMSRYALVIFPMFIVLGMWGTNRWVNRLVVYSSVLLQLYLSAQFILWGWVA